MADASKNEQPEKPASAQDEKKDAPKPEPKDEAVETHHTVVIDGQEIAYTATAGRMVMKNEDGKAKAVIFYIAYVKQGVTDPAQRPLTISFNGGPGSSSVWLHLGVLGPRRVVSGDVDAIAPPPYRLIDNAYSLLDVTDLVFIDPVSTGYSRPVEGEEAKQFHGLEQDIESVGDFIRLYITRAKRWSSPKFLIGESYGTTRAAGLSGHLQQRFGMYLNGIMLVSLILNFQTCNFHPGNDLPYILFLPTYTATAWYHNKLPPDLQADLPATLAEVEAFAAGEYTLALMAGDTFQGERRIALVDKLARYTGLSPDYIERSNLRIEIFRFTKELLRDQRRTVGRLDTRFVGIDRNAAGEHFEYDPSYAAIQGSYSGAFAAYVAEELNFLSDLPYEVLAGLYEKWDYSKHQNKYVDVAETLRGAMTRNPFLKVFVASGYFDLATPYFAADYTLNHMALDPTLTGNLVKKYYPAGHMMYVHEPSLASLKADLAAFVTGA